MLLLLFGSYVQRLTDHYYNKRVQRNATSYFPTETLPGSRGRTGRLSILLHGAAGQATHQREGTRKDRESTIARRHCTRWRSHPTGVTITIEIGKLVKLIIEVRIHERIDVGTRLGDWIWSIGGLSERLRRALTGEIRRER